MAGSRKNDDLAAIAVTITHGAERDLHRIWARRLAQRGANGKDGADALLDALVGRIESLATLPLRGPVPVELASLGITDYRQFTHPPYRIIYRVTASNGDSDGVVVMLIADSRRDFRALLEERLIHPNES